MGHDLYLAMGHRVEHSLQDTAEGRNNYGNAGCQDQLGDQWIPPCNEMDIFGEGEGKKNSDVGISPCILTDAVNTSFYGGAAPFPPNPSAISDIGVRR
jgi:hypothetical protein